jgi:uncharacterized protein
MPVAERAEPRLTIAVAGLGGIGGGAAGSLAAAGRHDVIACARQTIGRFTLDRQSGVVALPLTVLSEPEQAKPVDWVLLCTKAHQTQTAAPWLQRCARLSNRAPPESMMLSDLDGYLTGIAVGPAFVSPSEWLPVIWGDEEPKFSHQDEANAIIGVIMARYDEIVLQIADERCEPVFWVDQDGTSIVFAWADGFMRAVMLRADAWEKIFKSKRNQHLLNAIVAFCSDENGDLLIEQSREERDQLLDQAPSLIPRCVVEIAGFWRGRRSTISPLLTEKAMFEPTVTALKVGRNDPCACRSGKKFKKCCGKAEP